MHCGNLRFETPESVPMHKSPFTPNQTFHEMLSAKIPVQYSRLQRVRSQGTPGYDEQIKFLCIKIIDSSVENF